MAEPLSDRVIRRIDEAARLYHRLIMLVAPAGAGKTGALQDIHERLNAPLLNVNLALSRSMLDLTERQRILQLSRLLYELVNTVHADVVLLDNIEVLFDVSLKRTVAALFATLFMTPPQMGVQITAVDSVGINPLVDGFVADSHLLVVGVISNESSGDLLRRPVIDEFALNIVH